MLKTQEVQKPQFISIEKTNALKGLFAILVLLHHLGQNTTFFDKTFIDFILQTLGYLSVSVFLFLSGFGLTVSAKNKEKSYIDSFPKNKILPLYLQNLILIFIYYVFWRIIGENLSLRRIILSFFFGHTVVKYGWYIQATLILYIIFFVSQKAKNKAARITTFLLGYIAYFCLCYINNCWQMWYISVLAFVVGVIYAHLENKINFNIPFLSVVFLFLYILGNTSLLPNVVATLLKMGSSTVFPVIITEAIKQISLHLDFLQKIGKYCFEIYVSQGLFLTLFHSKIIYIENELLYSLISIVSTLIFAFLLKFIFSKIRFKK